MVFNCAIETMKMTSIYDLKSCDFGLQKELLCVTGFPADINYLGILGNIVMAVIRYQFQFIVSFVFFFQYLTIFPWMFSIDIFRNLSIVHFLFCLSICHFILINLVFKNSSLMYRMILFLGNWMVETWVLF